MRLSVRTPGGGASPSSSEVVPLPLPLPLAHVLPPYDWLPRPPPQQFHPPSPATLEFEVPLPRYDVLLNTAPLSAKPSSPAAERMRLLQTEVAMTTCLGEWRAAYSTSTRVRGRAVFPGLRPAPKGTRNGWGCFSRASCTLCVFSARRRRVFPKDFAVGAVAFRLTR